MEAVIIYPENKSQLSALKAMAKALKIKIAESKEESPYDPVFVAKIKAGDEAMKKGKGRKMTIEELDNLWK